MRTHKKPIDIPANPEKVYKDQWTSMGDWFGTGRIADKYKDEIWLPFKEAQKEYQKIAKKYGIKTILDWHRFLKTHKLPANLPRTPEKIYTKERVWRKMKK